MWLGAGQAEGLTPPQAVSLMRLSADDPPSLGELARQMHCDASYATALADRLEGALYRLARLLAEHSDPEVAERMGIAMPEPR